MLDLLYDRFVIGNVGVELALFSRGRHVLLALHLILDIIILLVLIELGTEHQTMVFV